MASYDDDLYDECDDEEDSRFQSLEDLEEEDCEEDDFLDDEDEFDERYFYRNTTLLDDYKEHEEELDDIDENLDDEDY